MSGNISPSESPSKKVLPPLYGSHHEDKFPAPVAEEKPAAKPSTAGSTPGLNQLNPDLRRSGGTTNSSLNGTNSFATEISETLKTKMFEMKWVFIAIIVNSVLLYFIYALGNGVNVPMNAKIGTPIGAVVIELVLLIANVITITALDTSSYAYFGYLLSQREGYSLAVCGFTLFNSFIDKAQFANKLSLNSTCRKILSRLASLWVIVSVVLALTPLAATALHAYPVRQDDGTIGCLVYRQDGEPADRGWPDVVAETGIAEVIFGKAIGRLRSEEAVNVTTALITPQILGSVQDGDTIVGDGFTADIFTNCVCAPSTDTIGLETAGVDQAIISGLLHGAAELGSSYGLVNHLANHTQTLEITTLITGSALCGGLNDTNPFVPVCTTTFSNHKHATMLVQYMTDGTTASIAPKFAFIRQMHEDADLATWLIFSMQSILGGDYSTLRLPTPVPGLLSPLLWWGTPNLMVLDPALVEAGIETTFTILFRAAVQRTYSTEGTTCIRNVELGAISNLILNSGYGVPVAMTVLIIQLVASFVAILGFIPWLLTDAPIGPAVRMTRDSIYFTTVVHTSNQYVSDHLCNAPVHTIWQALDVIVRVGESHATRDDPIVGHITMDRPKLVATLSNGKRYF